MTNLDEYPALKLLGEHGIPTVAHRLAVGEAEVRAAAAAIGFPVVLKLSSEKALHKTELGGVLLNLKDEDEVVSGYRALMERADRAGIGPGSGLRGILVQEMVSGGSEFILGGFRDPCFGPVILFGLGGIYTELFKDAVFRLAPFDAAEAGRMVRETKASALIEGFRGSAPLDFGSLCATIARLSAMMDESEEILEFDINPFIVTGNRSIALDALFKLR